MAFTSTNPATANGGARQVFGSADQNKPAENKRQISATQVIRADLIGQCQATAAGITVTGRHAPVLSLCRALMEVDHDPATSLHAYRGVTLCLRVRSIGEGAKFTVKDGKTGRPRFARYAEEGGAAGPPAAQNDEEIAGEPERAKDALAGEASS
jgi:hypothetical protein